MSFDHKTFLQWYFNVAVSKADAFVTATHFQPSNSVMVGKTWRQPLEVIPKRIPGLLANIRQGESGWY
jgi:hypothetical protein